ncbi:MAG: hypothetical protein KIT73_12345 [Burkholderiales bacterium]|nr:hypothetical protein [Burkholderiales bacterium]
MQLAEMRTDPLQCCPSPKREQPDRLAVDSRLGNADIVRLPDVVDTDL